MIWHPLLIAVQVLDLLALFFALYGATSYLRVLLGWDPEATDLRQVALERATEGASLATRYATHLFIAASLLLVVAISLVLPSLVSGAMCGTGVMTAMGVLGWRALVLRGVALAALWVWRALDGINRSAPRPPAVPTVARWQLLALPLLGLAALYTLRALIALDPQQPVDCCQAVYDTFRTTREATTLAGLSDGWWLAATVVGASLLAGLVLFGLWRRAGAWLLLLLSAAWLPVAALTLVRVLAAYHYKVLHHHCPWCLFSLEYGAVGYLLYGALVVVALESLAVFSALRLLRAQPTLEERARRRQRRGLIALLLALLLFAALTAGPALLWRFSHGVWMHGG